MTDPAGPDDLLLSDAERLHALTVLGDHYASGRLDGPEFHARSGDVASARTLAQLDGSFRGLPGGVPLKSVDGMIVHAASAAGGQLEHSSSSTGASVPAVRDTDAELAELRKKGKLVESLDGIVIGVTLVSFLILQFVVGWNWAWIVWPSLALTLGIPRLILRYDDSDEETYGKIKEADQAEREERLRAANDRIRELGDGREKND